MANKNDIFSKLEPHIVPPECCGGWPERKKFPWRFPVQLIIGQLTELIQVVTMYRRFESGVVLNCHPNDPSRNHYRKYIGNMRPLSWK